MMRSETDVPWIWHAYTGFFAINTPIPYQGNFCLARGFVEFPSQFNEKLGVVPEILKKLPLCNYQSWEQIPQDLLIR